MASAAVARSVFMSFLAIRGIHPSPQDESIYAYIGVATLNSRGISRIRLGSLADLDRSR
jgi:hypothetical protein